MISSIRSHEIRKFVRWVYRNMPDKLVYSIHFYYKQRKLMHWKSSSGYNEKIQWLKLYYRNPAQTICADKYRVREYVSSRVGSGYLNELYGVYSSADEIDFKELPEKFVLKANHGTGMNVICTDKKNIDWDNTRKKLNAWLGVNPYHRIKEWQYKDIRPLIIAEKLIEGMDLFLDYRFYCYKGEPLFVRVMADKAIKNVREKIFTIDWMPIEGTIKFPLIEEIIPKPENYDVMVDVARKLAGDFPHVRVDLYNVGGTILFGEMTFHTGNGFTVFKDKKFERILGDPIVLKKYESSKDRG